MPAPAPAATGGRVAVLGSDDDPTRRQLADFVGQLGMEAVSGSWEALADVDYVLVSLAGDPGPDQWMELGFLLAMLGRTRMCFVPSGNAPALPARLDGIARQAVDDSGLWKLLLAREMKQAGLEVDLNRAL